MGLCFVWEMFAVGKEYFLKYVSWIRYHQNSEKSIMSTEPREGMIYRIVEEF